MLVSNGVSCVSNLSELISSTPLVYFASLPHVGCAAAGGDAETRTTPSGPGAEGDKGRSSIRQALEVTSGWPDTISSCRSETFL